MHVQLDPSLSHARLTHSPCSHPCHSPGTTLIDTSCQTQMCVYTYLLDHVDFLAQNACISEVHASVHAIVDVTAMAPSSLTKTSLQIYVKYHHTRLSDITEYTCSRGRGRGSGHQLEPGASQVHSRCIWRNAHACTRAQSGFGSMCENNQTQKIGNIPGWPLRGEYPT